MIQTRIFEDEPNNTPRRIGIGNDLCIECDQKQPGRVRVYRHSILIKNVDLSDKVQKRLLVVELVEIGAKSSLLAEALGISRQSIHNWIETKKHFGQEGLLHGYSVSKSKDIDKQRKLHADKRPIGNKAEILAKMRNEKIQESRKNQLQFHFSFAPQGCPEKIDKSLEPFEGEHDWEFSRYAGVFCWLIALQSVWKWFKLIIGHFGSTYRILLVFVLMVARNVRSIEQLKNVRKKEAGVILGLGRLPSKPVVWEWFYKASQKRKSSFLLQDFFNFQIRSGLIGLTKWFTDGHLLPYTGSEKVHCGYNTQRQMPEPGRTNIVTCDQSGRIALFDIQEGKGDLKQTILETGKRFSRELPACPIMVFDREGYDANFFFEMVESRIPFVTWQKNVNKSEIDSFGDACYSTRFQFNGKAYAVFEKDKPFAVNRDGKDIPFSLRRIFIWNITSNRKTCALAWTADYQMDARQCAEAALSRWGASENTFKHLKDRHPMHYHPGFKLSESKKQDIRNPEIKEKDSFLKSLKKKLAAMYKKLAGAKETVKKNGELRKNSTRQQIAKQIEEIETQVQEVIAQKKQLPERIDVSSLEDYRSFKQIDNEGKNLFDFVTSCVWNARKQMVDWLSSSYDDENDIVDLFYAIANSHGWIKSTATQVVVELEPLEQPKRRLAQEQLCRKLTSLGAVTPTGKAMAVQVAKNHRVKPKMSKNEGDF